MQMKMNHKRLQGLIAAVLTPLDNSQNVAGKQIAHFANHLLEQGVEGFYCCGSTGEGVSLTNQERMYIAEQWVAASAGRAPVIVQVGHNSPRDAAALAKHAQEIGASAVSATCPSYFKIDSVAGLVECMSEIASAAPLLPFYYYHIPSLTGNRISMPAFLGQAGKAIPNLVGMKYTSTELHEFLECARLENGRFEVIWGVDEMLLGALAMGTQAAIGSTYNIAAPLYRKLINAFRAGDMELARQIQLESIAFINALKRFPFFSALKHVVSLRGIEMGGCRNPNGNLSTEQATQLKEALLAAKFPV